MKLSALFCALFGHRWQLVPRTDPRAAKLLRFQVLKQCKRCGETEVEELTFGHPFGHGGGNAA